MRVIGNVVLSKPVAGLAGPTLVKPIFDIDGRRLRAGGGREWWTSYHIDVSPFSFARTHAPRCPEDAGFLAGAEPTFLNSAI